MSDIKFTITSKELLDRQGLRIKSNGNWWSVKTCPFCDGGKQKQVYTFGVHKIDGNYNCLRTKCGEASNFWNLLKFFDLNPSDYIDKDKSTNSKKKSKRYIYRKTI
ncbi:MAG: hypothetical protein WBP82_02865 [Leuconostoc mesenteroides]